MTLTPISAEKSNDLCSLKVIADDVTPAPNTFKAMNGERFIVKALKALQCKIDKNKNWNWDERRKNDNKLCKFY